MNPCCQCTRLVFTRIPFPEGDVAIATREKLLRCKERFILYNVLVGNIKQMSSILTPPQPSPPVSFPFIVDAGRFSKFNPVIIGGGGVGGLTTLIRGVG